MLMVSPQVGHQGYGALDMKMTSRRLAAKGRFWAVAGPPHGAGMPPFSWISTNLTSLPLYAPIQVERANIPRQFTMDHSNVLNSGI